MIGKCDELHLIFKNEKYNIKMLQVFCVRLLFYSDQGSSKENSL